MERLSIQVGESNRNLIVELFDQAHRAGFDADYFEALSEWTLIGNYSHRILFIRIIEQPTLDESARPNFYLAMPA